MNHVRHLVIGGGVVGLACAARLSKFGPTLLIERRSGVGEETSSRNSEVIHAGIYYPNDSIKTRVCIEGRKMLYRLAQRRNIPHRKIGKWIFSTSKDESNYLGNLEVKCKALGVPLRRLSSREIQSGEPHLRAVDAVESPETGIVDSHTLMQVFSSIITDNGSDIALQASFQGATRSSESSPFKAVINLDDGSSFEVMADSIINSAGLSADHVARSILGSATPDEYKLHYLKGYYFSYSGKSLVSRLAYPIPDKHLKTLGTHATLDLAGRMKFGPDAHWTDRADDFAIAPNDFQRLGDLFYETVRTYLPSIQREKLVPDYAGIRPKLAGPNSPLFRDFIIQEESNRGFPGLINLVGIESPGLTSSMAIAKEVAHLLGISQHNDDFDL